ncbi:serine hydrolase [Fulvivirga kasyanovii]|uniref:Class C beta-lactamase-related serine hydrolase n=1 Tax=Fulvivirga kasyanovii TaxID=396812 RepID=A0ABW9RTA3_9BACT|nr:serine hydrolase [Fulvivirga kasyanovii]MTI26922.1 class C beta-lactamase-related serine hydrolase [Fulvivirga kasyanovii]
MNRTVAIVIFVFIGITAYSQNDYVYNRPQQLNDGWDTANLRSQKIDTARIYRLFEQFQHENHKIHSVLVVKNDQLIVEEYFGKNTLDLQHDLRSVTKSITSILMGIAMDKGFIESIDDPVTKYIEQPKAEKEPDQRKGDITIRHLLTMSTGHDCNDWDKGSKGREDKVYRKSDWLQYFMDLPMVNDPGEVSNYCTMAQVLANEIITRASGMAIDKFAQTYLFDPLQIKNISWGHTSDKPVIPAAKRLYMIPRDMAKIGQLILNNGEWKGQQVVSKSWIEESTTPKTKITGIDYGFLWWNMPFQVNGNKTVAKLATGNGGQYIFIFPELSMVAVFTGGAYNSSDDKLPFAIVKDVLLPSFD